MSNPKPSQDIPLDMLVHCLKVWTSIFCISESLLLRWAGVYDLGERGHLRDIAMTVVEGVGSKFHSPAIPAVVG